MKMSTITVKGRNNNFYKDWGSGPVVTFSHGWPLCSDAWIAKLSSRPERIPRGRHDGEATGIESSLGRERHEWYADDLAALTEALDLTDVTMVGPLHGRGEVARYIGRHGTKRYAAAVLIGAGTAGHGEVSAPSAMGFQSKYLMNCAAGCSLRTVLSSGKTSPSVLWRQSARRESSQGMLDQFWLWSMQGGLKNVYDSIKAFSETDLSRRTSRNSTCPRW